MPNRALLAGIVLALLALPALAEGPEGPPPYPAPKLPPGALTPEERRVFDTALSSILLDGKDLAFKKDAVDDPFRLEAVQRALSDPFSLVDWTYGWDAFLLERKTPEEILLRAARDLDSVPPESRGVLPPRFRELKPPPEVPAEWVQAVAALDFRVAQLRRELAEQVLGAMKEEDREYLGSYLLCRFLLPKERPAGLECPSEEAYGADPRFLGIVKSFDLGGLLAIGAELSKYVRLSVETLAALPAMTGLREPARFDGLSGPIWIGTAGDDAWRMDAGEHPSILIDPAGNDLYDGGVGAGGSLRGEKNPLIAIAIDLAGSDVYRSGGGRSNGSGALGIGIQIDLQGDDTYLAGKFSQGCGLFGIGVLEDRSGDDSYRADLLVQGAGAIGAGLLLDDAGRDSYHGAFYAQGFGYTRGLGLLSDRDGYDDYYAGGRYDDWPTWGPYILSCSQGYAFGIRPVASGGIGILHDRNGKDHYSAEVFSQGGSYWYGIGAVIDDNGDDQYHTQVYSQGAGVHLSTGILLDRGGNDNYTCVNQCQGFAHDFSVGWLIDEDGNDLYTAQTNAQGCAVTNSVAGLIDRAGDDGYLCRDPAKGGGYGGGTARGYGNIGVQVDMRGKDVYSYPGARDGAWWTMQSWYAGIDVGEDWWTVTKDESGKETGRTLRIPGVDR